MWNLKVQNKPFVQNIFHYGINDSDFIIKSLTDLIYNMFSVFSTLAVLHRLQETNSDRNRLVMI